MSAALRAGNNNYAPVSPKDTRSKLKTGLARGSRLVLPAVAALGIGAPVSAFELGQLEIHSTLGQPLRASIAYALNPGEEIGSYCIYVSPGRSASGFPSAGPTSAIVENGSIRLLGNRPVSDPLLALQLTVDCPYAAHVSREYVAFVSPAAAAADRPRTPVRTAPPAAEPGPLAREPVTPLPIAAGTSYRVRPGDTLSGIAERIDGRSVSIWQAVDALFAANPNAFIGGNRDFLKAGAELRIPDALYGTARGAEAAPLISPGMRPAAAAGAEAASAPYTGYGREAGRIESERAAAAEPVTTAPAAVAQSSAPGPGTAAAPAAADAKTDDIRPTDAPFAEPAEAAPAAAVLPEGRPGATFEAPLRRVPAAGPGAWSWLIWLGGTGIALILALLIGRPLRKRFGSEFERPFPDANRDRESLPPPVVVTPEPAPESGLEVDFHLDEADADARLIRVDVDVEDGSGFQDSGEIDVAQDFGFSASDGIELGLDVEFPEEPATAVEADTSIIPSIRRESGMVVEREIPPGSEETGTYDVSMIVDATQQPLGEGDDTTRDLHAIELDADEAGPEEDPLTLSREMDYKILEQDYQDELTATQALDAELADAARDLARRLDTGVPASPDGSTAEPALTDEGTVPHPAAVALAEADTVEMPARGGEPLDDTDVNEELPSAMNDATAEMEVESATVDTRKMKVS